MNTQQLQTLNGYDPNELKGIADAVASDPKQANITFQVSTAWVDGPRSISRVKSYEWGNETYDRDFTLVIDEPEEVGGTNLGPNPQEVLLSAINSCLLATFTELCTVEGIQLEKVEIVSRGHLDLRGFFGLDASISPGYQSLDWTLIVKGDASAEQFQQIYEATITASPNLWNMAHPVTLVPQLQIEA
ncbi:OsmC family protein (plasmid) [Acaryochloris sp. CCMEE 5410]|nr:OsmC family protein [Acaryochloris sp. CCMEE 5410]KAI9129827.1 OsmC family protein [Acaryochloris sp. CCMEE 5410]